MPNTNSGSPGANSPLTPDGGTPGRPTDERPKRLVVELNRKAYDDLTWVTDVEEINKTTAVNRAVQVYRVAVETQMQGKAIAVIDDPANPRTFTVLRIM